MEDPINKHERTDNISQIKYKKFVQSAQFKSLVQRKKRFIVPTVIGFVICYFLLPILATYTTLLKGETIFGITYVWVFALFQFLVIWILGIVFMKKSAQYDRDVKDILDQFKEDL